MDTASESPAVKRREALRMMRNGTLMFVIAGGLFGLYCWWAIVVGDPPRGTWRWRALVLLGGLIHWALIILLGVALAGPCAVYSGARQWLLSWRPERPRPPEPVKVACLVLQARLECPRCGAAAKRLPPNGISPRPGYRCSACGTKMHAPGMRFVYLVAFVLGAGVAGVFLVAPFVDGGGIALAIQGLWFVVAGLICTVYSLRQVLRPCPRRRLCAKVRQDLP